MDTDKKPIETVTEYWETIKRFTEGYASDDTRCFFRGQDQKYENDFAPSVKRINASKEHDIYYDVLTACTDDFSENLTYGEILAKMQHYGVPTRLLDVTSNPLVALYFACQGSSKEEGTVYVFYFEKRYIKTFESDAIAILASLPRISYDDYKEVYNEVMDFFGDNEGDDDALEKVNNNESVQRLLHEIKKEKPDFDELHDPQALLNDLVYIPKQNNSRIVRQYGAFILFGMADLEPFEANNKGDSSFTLNRIKVSGNHKDHLLTELKMLGISQSTLFPELYTVAESIKNDPKYKKV